MRSCCVLYVGSCVRCDHVILCLVWSSFLVFLSMVCTGCACLGNSLVGELRFQTLYLASFVPDELVCFSLVQVAMGSEVVMWDVAGNVVPCAKFDVKGEWNSRGCVVLILAKCLSDEASIGGLVIARRLWHCWPQLQG